MGCCLGKDKAPNEYISNMENKYFPPSNLNSDNQIVNLLENQIDTIKGTFGGIEQTFKGIELNPTLKNIELNKHDINPFDVSEYKNNTKSDLMECEYFISNDKNTSIHKIFKTDTPEIFYLQHSYNGIFGLFFSAYCYHKNLLLRPDDIWFHILEQINEIINSNPEKYKKTFVDTDEKQTISIRINSQKMDKQAMNDVISMINEKLNKKVKNDFVNITNSEFTTTSQFDKTLYGIMTMVQLKNYFNYEIEVSCGIRKIYFGGELKDWEKIIKNLKELKKFGKEFDNYSSKVIPIIQEFINAYNLKPNIGFFNRAIRKDAQMAGHIKSDAYTLGESYDIKRYVDGWIKDLYWFANNQNTLPKYFGSQEYSCDVQITYNCESDFTITKELATSNSEGILYHDSIDSFSMLKSWSVRNKKLETIW